MFLCISELNIDDALGNQIPSSENKEVTYASVFFP